MRISEKTLELTLCCQMGWQLFHPLQRPVGDPIAPQPIWFGLTQQQEARSGFDAATRLGNRNVLLLQFKAGRQLKSKGIRFSASHAQLLALQGHVNRNPRRVFYVLPEITRTRDLNSNDAWVLARTWFLDVGDIPSLSAPTRLSRHHHLTLDVTNKIVTIASDPVDVRVTPGTRMTNGFPFEPLGRKYKSFDDLWEIARVLGRGALAVALPTTGGSFNPSC